MVPLLKKEMIIGYGTASQKKEITITLSMKQNGGSLTLQILPLVAATPLIGILSKL